MRPQNLEQLKWMRTADSQQKARQANPPPDDNAIDNPSTHNKIPRTLSSVAEPIYALGGTMPTAPKETAEQDLRKKRKAAIRNSVMGAWNGNELLISFEHINHVRKDLGLRPYNDMAELVARREHHLTAIVNLRRKIDTQKR